MGTRKGTRKAKAPARKAICCPCCGVEFTDAELQAIYEARRRQVGGKMSAEAKRPSFPEGWIGIREASSLMGIEYGTLMKRAKCGSPVFRQFEGHWAVLRELVR